MVRGAPDNAAVLSAADALARPRSDSPKPPSKQAPSDQPTTEDGFASVDQIRRVIYGRLSLELDTALDDVATVFGFSTRSLKRHLASEGNTFSSVVEEVKIAEAKRLLAETDLPITEIADLLRYRHLPSFTRAFSRSTGSPPSEFRKAITTDQEP